MEEKFEFLLYGQIYGNSGRVYAYPISNVEYNQKGIPPWMNKIPADSRYIRSISTDDCYSIRWGEEGFSYAYTFTPGSSRDDKVMLVLHVGKAVITDASELIKIFKCLSDYIVNCSLVEEIRNDDLRDILNPLSSILRPVVLNTTPHVTTKDAVVYYTSDTELVKLLQDVAQRDYQSYNWIHIVNSECKRTISETDKYSLFPSAQIQKGYFYETPRATMENDIEVSVMPNFAAVGEKLEITYAKSNGFVFKTTAKVGYASEYISEGSGNVRRIKDARSINIKFTKEIPVRVHDENYKTIENFSIDDINEQNKVVYIEENQTKTITISAKGYLHKKIKVSANQDEVAVTLQSNSFERTGTTKDKSFHFPKISFIVSCVLLILIVGFVCFFSGKLYQQSQTEKEETDKKTSECYSQNEQINKDEETIDELRSNLNQLCTDTSSLNNKIRTLEQQLDNKKNSVSTEATYWFAQQYLEKNDKWSTSMMINECKTKKCEEKDVKASPAYIFLNNLTGSTSDFSKLIKFAIENDTWKGIQECYDTKIKNDKSPQQLQEARNNSIINNPGQAPSIDLSGLKRNINNTN